MSTQATDPSSEKRRGSASSEAQGLRDLLGPSARLPEYQANSIVNLMASLIAAREGAATHPTLALLPPEELESTRHIVLLVIDGLGAHWLRRQSPNGILASNMLGTISSVFPSTTASAISTFLTGDEPRQHGITGWHMWIRELGCVMAVLPGTPRYGGVGYAQAGIDPKRLFRSKSVFERMGVETSAVSPARIANSDFNRAHCGTARVRSYGKLSGLFKQIARAVRWGKNNTYTYAYWPGLDAIGHQAGMGSPAAIAHFQELESGIAQLMKRLSGDRVRLLVCADHGQVDCAPPSRLSLETLPELRDCLSMPLCGEPRAAYCYLRPGSEARFDELVETSLRDRFVSVPSRALIDAGLFGLGNSHTALETRVGDRLLVAREDHILFDRPDLGLRREAPGAPATFNQIGVHGGLSEDEMLVPLCML